MTVFFLLLITSTAIKVSSECPAVLDITSDTSCRNSSTDSVFISISCTVPCGVPVIILNGGNTFNIIQDEKITKTCLGTDPNCGYIECQGSPDPAINITMQKQGFIPAGKITSCMYIIACKSSKPGCTNKTEKTLLLRECDNIPAPKCTVPLISSVKPIINMTTVTMVTTVTQSILEVLPCTELLTSNVIGPTCDCTSFYDIISTPTVSPISTSISCNMSSQLPHTTTSIITTTITSTTYSICSSSVPAPTPETTFPTISLPQSVVYGVEAGIGILVIVLIVLILVIVVMGVCLCRRRRPQMDRKVSVDASALNPTMVNGMYDDTRPQLNPLSLTMRQ